MRQWIGLIILVIAGWYAWNALELGDKLGEKEPATPEVAWYLDNVDHHFSIVRERDNTYYFRGFHENKSAKPVLGGTFTIRMKKDGEWRYLKSIPFPILEPGDRKTFDVPLLEIPRDDERRSVEWELTKVRLRGGS